MYKRQGLAVVLGDGLARVIPDLQGPDDPLGIVGVEPGRRLRVHLAQLLPQGIQAALGRLGLEPGPVSYTHLDVYKRQGSGGAG